MSLKAPDTTKNRSDSGTIGSKLQVKARSTEIPIGGRPLYWLCENTEPQIIVIIVVVAVELLKLLVTSRSLYREVNKSTTDSGVYFTFLKLRVRKNHSTGND